MSSINRNVIANYLGQGWASLMGLAFIPLYIEYLGIEAYGLIGLFAVMQALLTLLDMGMTPTLNREMARYTASAHTAQSIHDLLRSLEVIAFCIAIILSLSIYVVADILANDWLNAKKLSVTVVSQSLSIMGLVVSIRFVESIYRGSLFGLQRQVWYNVVNALMATLRHGGVLLVLIWISSDIQVFFFWQALMSFLSVFILSVGVRKAMPNPPAPPRFNASSVKDVWKFASGMMLVTFLAICLTQTDKILLSRLLSLEDFGYYALAATIAGATYMLVSPIVSAMYPRMVELFTRNDLLSLARIYHLGAQLVTVLIAPIVLLLSVFSQNVVFMWSGSLTLAENTGPILSVFVIGVFLNCLMSFPGHLQQAYGWVSLGVKVNATAVVLLIPTIYLVVPHFGAIGAAWIWVALNAGYVFVALQLMHRRLFPSEKWRWYIADVFLPLSGAIGVMLIANEFNSHSYQDRWGDALFLFVVVGLAYAAAIMLADQVRPKVIGYFWNRN